MERQWGGGFAELIHHWQAYQKQLDLIEDEVDGAPDAGAFYHALKAILPLERAARNGASVMQLLREKVSADKKLIALRDAAYEVTRQAELLQLECRAGLDFSMAQEAEKQSKYDGQVAKMGNRLNLIAAFFLPLTALASLFGMNLESGIDGRNTLYFYLVLIVGLAIGVLLKGTLDADK